MTVAINRRNTSADTAEGLAQRAHALLDSAGIVRSPSWISRTVRAFTRSPVEGMPFARFLLARVQLNAIQRKRIAERDDLRYLLVYSDPTGEAAVRNIMRGSS